MAWLSCLRQKEPQITRLNSILSRGHGQSLCARTFTFEPITTRNTFGYFCRSFLGHDSTPSFLAQQLVAFTQGNATATTLAVLWGSGFLSANIPYVAAMNPLIVDLARTLHPDVADYTALEHQPDILPLWWALGWAPVLVEMVP